MSSAISTAKVEATRSRLNPLTIPQDQVAKAKD